MKRVLILALVLLIGGVSETIAQGCFGTSCLPQEARDNCTENKSNGCIDWANGVIYAVGMGVPNPNFKSVAQKRYSAYQAAKVVAMRNLLQMVEEVNISSSRKVKNGMLESDEIYTQINGRLRNVIEAGHPKSENDGSMWVTMKMHTRDIMSILLNNEQLGVQGVPARGQAAVPAPAPAPIQPSTVAPPPPKSEEGVKYGGDENIIYGGLIIDASDNRVSPALSPKIYDEAGKEVYGSADVNRDFALRHGIVGYVKGLNEALKNDRFERKPLVVKALKTGGKSSDLVISNKDAELLRKLEVTQTFLREARVVIAIP